MTSEKHSSPASHFQGRSKKRGSKRKSGKGERKRKRMLNVRHNKYSHLAPKRKDPRKGMQFRDLPLEGKPGELIEAGIIYLWHGRKYRLIKNVKIPPIGKIFGRFKLIK